MRPEIAHMNHSTATSIILTSTFVERHLSLHLYFAQSMPNILDSLGKLTLNFLTSVTEYD